MEVNRQFKQFEVVIKEGIAKRLQDELARVGLETPQEIMAAYFKDTGMGPPGRSTLQSWLEGADVKGKRRTPSLPFHFIRWAVKHKHIDLHYLIFG